MRHNSIAAVLCVLFALPLLAQPKITSIDPASGPVIGGTAIGITGSGFAMCPVCSPPTPPVVLVGGIAATNVKVYDQFLLTAVTPPHLPRHATVSVTQWNGTATSADSFEYVGDPGDAFDRLLVPIYLEPIRGLYGSEFRTAFETINRSDANLPVYGLARNCNNGGVIGPCSGTDPLDSPAILGPNNGSPVPRTKDGTPGRLLWVPLGRGRDLQLNLRAYDTSRNASSFGTEMPIVHESDFRPDRIVLLGVPFDTNFRNTLRIYGDSSTARVVSVKIGDEQPVHVNLTAGADMFQPAFATVTAFPSAPTPVGTPDAVATQRVEITLEDSFPNPLFNPARIWAFVTATNNTTQEITTITPH